MNYRKAKENDIPCAHCKWCVMMLELWCLVDVDRTKPHAVFIDETCDRAERKGE